MIPKPFKECKYCGFNDHHSDNCKYYPGCEDYLKRSVWYLDSGFSRHMTGIKQYLHRYSKESGPKVVFGDDSFGDTEGYGSLNCNGITFTRVAYVNGLKHNLISISQLCDANFIILFTKTRGTIFNQNDEEKHKKSDAADCLMSFIRKMENLNKVRVKELRSDNGTEFRNHKLEDFCDEKGISQNFSSPCTPEQNGVVERRNKTLIEAARTISIIVKRHGKTAYDVFRGRSPDISYFHVFGCPVHINNHKDHLGKFNEKADDGFFLGYSPVAKAFKVFNIRRQEMEETIHVTFSEDDEAISQSSTEGDAINFNENRSFLDYEFLEPRSKVTQCSVNIEYFPYIPLYENITPIDSPILQDSVSPKEPPEFTSADDHLAFSEHDHFESGDNLIPAKIQDNVIIEPISDTQSSPTTISPSTEAILQTLVPQDRWSREKHIELVNIIGEPLAGITTRSRVRDLEAASAHECLYVNFISEMKPKKIIEALEE
ncbi:retrovirus-related pol polyprotein from transposon TNT 1-94 [Tanacetum coccineum]